MKLLNILLTPAVCNTITLAGHSKFTNSDFIPSTDGILKNYVGLFKKETNVEILTSLSNQQSILIYTTLIKISLKIRLPPFADTKEKLEPSF